MKKMNKKGFTLAELLIVVAIIAVLIAIMIPVFGGALGKAEHAKNLANVRANYAEAVVTAMTGDSFGKDGKVAITVSAADLAKNTSKDCVITYDSTASKITVTTAGNYTDSFPIDTDVKVG